MNAEQQVRPLPLASISEAEFKLGQILASKQRQFQTSINDLPIFLVLAGLAKSEAPGYQITIELNGQPCQLFIGQHILDLLLPDKIDHSAVSKLPEELMISVINFSLQPLLQTLHHTFGLSTSLIGFDRTENYQEERLALGIRANDVNCSIQLALNPLILQILDRIPAQQPPQLPDIPFWASLQKGHTCLTHSEYQDLEAGDIVFLDTHCTSEQVIIRLNRRVSWLATAQGDRITVAQRLQTMDEYSENPNNEISSEQEEVSQEYEQLDEMAADEAFPEADIMPVDASDLPVTLMFEVGEQRMTASEIQGLHNGYTFLLDNPVDQPVKLRANGKLIGECQLVEVEGRLGAQISRLEGH